MRGKQIKAELLLGAVLVLLATGAGGMLVRPSIEPDQVLPARVGDVVWNHELHARMKGIANCSVCHHTERQGVTQPRPCRKCHALPSNRDALILADLFVPVEKKTYSGEEGPPAPTAFHNKCVGCHKAMEQGPVACRDCHAQSFSGDFGLVEWDHRNHARKMDVDCVRCHHQDKDAQKDEDYRACGVCHKPAKTLALPWATGLANHENKQHGKCWTCHTQYNPESDRRSCRDCHLEMAAFQGVPVPGLDAFAPTLEEAIHKRCRECHDLSYPGLRRDMPVLCTDCHKPDPSLIRTSDQGLVLWSHKRHAEYEEWTCEKCHHTDIPGEPHMACRSCHGTGYFSDIPDVHKAMNQRCTGCHEEKAVGLTQWESMVSTKESLSLFSFEGEEGRFWWDHGLHAVGLSLSCRDCHHNTAMKDGVYVTAARAGPAWTDASARIQSCRNCHGEDGPVAGSAAEGSKALNLEGAFQKACVACHQRMACGPLEWSAFFIPAEDR